MSVSPIFGVANEVAIWYNGAKLVLNLDRYSVDFAGRDRILARWSVGPRIYEAAACGATIVSQDNVPELQTLLDGNYLGFDTPEELEGTVREWLAEEKDKERNEIGKRAQACMEGHSYTDRAMQLLDTLRI